MQKRSTVVSLNADDDGSLRPVPAATARVSSFDASTAAGMDCGTRQLPIEGQGRRRRHRGVGPLSAGMAVVRRHGSLDPALTSGRVTTGACHTRAEARALGLDRFGCA